MVAREGGVHVVISGQQLLDQLLLTESGDDLHDPVLHLLTYSVQLLMTQRDKACVGGEGIEGRDVAQGA